MNDPVFFVWVDGLNGPSPQLWFGDKTETMRPVPTLFKKRLGEEDRGLTFEDMQKTYPPPATPAEAKVKLRGEGTGAPATSARGSTAEEQLS